MFGLQAFTKLYDLWGEMGKVWSVKEFEGGKWMKVVEGEGKRQKEGEMGHRARYSYSWFQPYYKCYKNIYFCAKNIRFIKKHLFLRHS